MKNKLLIMMLISALAISGIGGMTLTARAANTADRAFSFDNRNSSGYSTWRDKNNATKVYVYPTAGPKIYYTVYGRKDTVSSGNKRSNKVAIPLGVQGSITNQVNENSGIQACLKYDRITTAYVATSGVWSPDSTKNYTVYN
ncbi:MAG: hypothetical protein K2K56_09360 [Lachnospiraceae bacterium]|nr:hypothetical protein [Lachnospiraceae bacterium]